MNKDLNTLKQVDVYSLILFALYQIKDIPEYSTLSELAYVLDKPNLFSLLDYFGGTTITIPTKRELQTIVNALLLYQTIKLEKLSFSSALSKLGKIDGLQLKEIKTLYGKLCDVLDRYYING